MIAEGFNLSEGSGIMEWRGVISCLPTTTNILGAGGHMGVRLMCPQCEIFNETSMHCLVTCNFAWRYRSGDIIDKMNSFYRSITMR